MASKKKETKKQDKKPKKPRPIEPIGGGRYLSGMTGMGTGTDR